MKTLNMILLLISLIALSCTTEPDPVNWGTDQCEHCRMTLADNKFGSELITKKGKCYKFDAVECMLNFMKSGKVQESDISKYVVINTSDPGKFVNAADAVYLISENFPSPMGANLSAYGTKSSAEEYQGRYKGEIKNWNDLLIQFKVK